MSKYDATLTILATTLSEAAVKDEVEGFDIGAGLFGEHLSEWLRNTAEEISDEKRPAPIPDWFCNIAITPRGVNCKHFEVPNTCLNVGNLCDHQVPF